MCKKDSKKRKSESILLSSESPLSFLLIPTAQVPCVIRMVLHKPLARIQVPFSRSETYQHSEYSLVRIMNEMEKIVTQSPSMYVPVEKFKSRAQAATYLLLPQLLRPLRRLVFPEKKHCLSPWEERASSSSASPRLHLYSLSFNSFEIPKIKLINHSN